MKNDKYIESLLDKFFQGETTIEQERELSKYFANSKSVPEKWRAYKEMFAYFDAGMPVEVDRKQKHTITRPVWVLLATAAAVTLLFMVAPHLYQNSEQYKSVKKPALTVAKRLTEKTAPVDSTCYETTTQITPIIAKQESKRIKNVNKAVAKPRISLDSVEIEREKGKMEQAQQELMADMFVIEQEREEIKMEQDYSRAKTYQAQRQFNNENPQFIQVVFK